MTTMGEAAASGPAHEHTMPVEGPGSVRVVTRRRRSATLPEAGADPLERVRIAVAPRATRILLLFLGGLAVVVPFVGDGVACVLALALLMSFVLASRVESTVTRMAPVSLGLQVAGVGCVSTVLEPMGLGVVSRPSALVLYLVACTCVVLVGVLGRPRSLVIADSTDLLVVGAVTVGCLVLAGVLWRSDAHALTWISQGGDFVNHLSITGQVLNAGHTMHFTAGFVGGYPHYLHAWTAFATEAPTAAATPLDFVFLAARLELLLYLLAGVALASAAATWVRSRVGVAGAAVAAAIVVVLLSGRPFVQYSLLSGFYSTVAAATWLAASILVMGAARGELTRVVLLGAMTVATVGTWTIVAVVPGVLLVVCVVRWWIERGGLQPVRPRPMVAFGIAALIGAPALIAPLVAALRGGADEQLAAVGASFPLPALAGLLGCAALGAMVLSLSAVPWRARLEIAGPMLLLAAAAAVTTAMVGLDPSGSGQLAYYPKKISWFVYVLGVPVAALLLGLAVGSVAASFGRRGAAWTLTAMTILGGVIGGQYMGYYAVLKDMRTVTNTLTEAEAEAFIRASTQANLDLAANGGGVLVIGAKRWFDERQLTGLAGVSSTMFAPFDANIYVNDPSYAQRCAAVAAQNLDRVSVLSVGDAPIPECVSSLPSFSIVDGSGG